MNRYYLYKKYLGLIIIYGNNPDDMLCLTQVVTA